MSKKIRHYSFLDKACLQFDQFLDYITNQHDKHNSQLNRRYPAAEVEEFSMTSEQRFHSAGLMRVNHSGEICAQALYQAQGIVSRSNKVRDKMKQAALEEGDHLAWCKTRLIELGSHTSYLNPIWYSGSFILGLTAGLIGDRWSLGFLAETEQQVVKHLEKHLKDLPVQDQKSNRILQQMQIDEAKHRDDALDAGGRELPVLVRKLMQLTSKIMVKTAYWV